MMVNTDSKNAICTRKSIVTWMCHCDITYLCNEGNSIAPGPESHVHTLHLLLEAVR